MNVRLYDPILHRFLQVDNYIQDPTNTQNYNQYGYVLNNPLKYTDPSGNAFNDGKDCANCGPTEVQQTAIGNGIKTIKDNWDDWGIKDWAKKNLNFNSWGRTWNKLWGKGSDHTSSPPPNRSTYVSVSNQAMNNVVQKIRIDSNGDEWLINGGYNPDRDISGMDESSRDLYVKRMRQNVYPADILYSDTGNTTIKYDSAISDYGGYNNKQVTIYAKAFTTNRNLFLTIMHEGMHAWDYHHGLIPLWDSNFRVITETRAYEMMRYFDKNVFNNGDHSHYYNLYSNMANQSGFNNFSIQSYPIFFNNIQR